ncbi:proton myo-inositol cotransporter-like [Panulirus ornatus]|uniref:proton myo-inositol cotransporter-like n=1 Tax=Panulirus ornatus TaxID=150431 RepID=UPI003A838967
MALKDLDAKATDEGVGADGGVDVNDPDDGGGGGVTRGLVLMTFMSSLSGFITGYDQGIIANCMTFISEELHVTVVWHQIIVGGIYIMGTVTSLFAGLLTDRLGRWIVIVISSVTYLVAAVVMATAQNTPQILVSRLLVGFSGGLSTMSAPVYMSECSPSRLRGRITTVYTFMIAMALVVANLAGSPFAIIPNGWRYMMGLSSIPALIQFIGFSFLPESPRWLVMKGKWVSWSLRRVRSPDGLRGQVGSPGGLKGQVGSPGGLKGQAGLLVVFKDRWISWWS